MEKHQSLPIVIKEIHATIETLEGTEQIVFFSADSLFCSSIRRQRPWCVYPLLILFPSKTSPTAKRQEAAVLMKAEKKES
jgi:hypothetical protein